MYISPTEASGGGLCATQAATHLPALPSKHIGSGPGVSGASGMHVQPFLPARTWFILPSAPAVTTAASWASAAGAADSALATGSLLALLVELVVLVLVSAVAVLLVAVPVLAHAPAASAAPAISRMRIFVDVISPLHCLRGPANYHTLGRQARRAGGA